MKTSEEQEEVNYLVCTENVGDFSHKSPEKSQEVNIIEKGDFESFGLKDQISRNNHG